MVNKGEHTIEELQGLAVGLVCIGMAQAHGGMILSDLEIQMIKEWCKNHGIYYKWYRQIEHIINKLENEKYSKKDIIKELILREKKYSDKIKKRFIK